MPFPLSRCHGLGALFFSVVLQLKPCAAFSFPPSNWRQKMQRSCIEIRKNYWKQQWNEIINSNNNTNNKRYKKRKLFTQKISYNKQILDSSIYHVFWFFSSLALTWSGTELHSDHGHNPSQILQKINSALAKSMTQDNSIFLFYLVFRLRKKISRKWNSFTLSKEITLKLTHSKNFFQLTANLWIIWSVNSTFMKPILHTQNMNTKTAYLKYIYESYHKKLDAIWLIIVWSKINTFYCTEILEFYTCNCILPLCGIYLM